MNPAITTSMFPLIVGGFFDLCWDKYKTNENEGQMSVL